MYICVYIYIYIHMYIDICICIYASMFIYIYIHTYTYTHYIHIHTYIYIYYWAGNHHTDETRTAVEQLTTIVITMQVLKMDHVPPVFSTIRLKYTESILSVITIWHY